VVRENRPKDLPLFRPLDQAKGLTTGSRLRVMRPQASKSFRCDSLRSLDSGRSLVRLKRRGFLFFLSVLSTFATQSGCAGLTGAATSTTVAVSVTPSSATVTAGSTQQFVANVTGSSNTAVSWAVTGADCSGATCGTTSSNGLYVAPTTVPSSDVVTLKATSVADPTKSASANVTIIPTAVVTLAPTNVSVATGSTEQFNATVTGTSNTAITWTVSGAGCSGIACGTITSNGLYTAPATVPASPLVTITATSVVDSSRSASAEATIVPPQAAGYKLVWQDNFGSLDVCKTNSDCNWYTPGTAIWGEQDPSSGVITDPSGNYVNLNWVANQKPIQATSMSTVSPNGAYYHAWQYGYFEASMAFTASTGSWPGIWMVPLSSINDDGYQDGGEIDVIEWQSSSPTTFSGSLHAWNNGAETDSEGITPTPEGINYNEFNTYGLLWTPTQICWYVNNLQMGCESTTTSPWTDVFNGFGPYALIFDQAAGCNWINNTVTPCTGQVSPLNLQVQWVHVYASPTQPSTVAEPTVSSPAVTGNPPNLAYYGSSATTLTWADTTSGATIYSCFSSGATCTPSASGATQTMSASGSYCANGQLSGYTTSGTVCVKATIGGPTPPSVGTICYFFEQSVSTMSCAVTAEAGDLIVAYADDLSYPTTGTVESITDSGGATDVPIFSLTNNPGSVAYYFADVSAGSHTITATLSKVVSYPLLQVIDIHRAALSSPIDTYVTNAQTTDTTAISSGPLTTTGANELLLGHVMGEGEGGTVAAAPSFSLIKAGGTTDYSAYYVASAIDSYTFNATSENSIQWSTSLIAIKPQ
jgi:beta-glucanase (GH16 family)